MDHVFPTWQADPAGSGTVNIAVAGTTTDEYASQRDYTYTATPAAGYEFLRFEFNIVYETHYGTTTNTHTYDPTESTNPFTSNDLINGSSYWWDYRPDIDGYGSITSIQVKAVFGNIRTGLLVYMPANGQLVYDPNRNGALVYDG